MRVSKILTDGFEQDIKHFKIKKTLSNNICRLLLRPEIKQHSLDFMTSNKSKKKISYN